MYYSILGAGGYIAPRHMKAIVDAGGEISAAYDHHASVGVLDRYSPDAFFTTYADEFWGHPPDSDDVAVICTPNWMHVSQAVRALDAGYKYVVVEKPLGMSPRDLAPLLAHERVDCVIPVAQLRYHWAVRGLKQMIARHNRQVECEIIYHAYRGPWYQRSWKWKEQTSGGPLLNLGIHFVDLCHHLFGALSGAAGLTTHGPTCVEGSMSFERAHVMFSLRSDVRQTQRVFNVDGLPIDLSAGMENLHRHIYDDLEAGDRPTVTVEEAASAVRTVNYLKQVFRHQL